MNLVAVTGHVGDGRCRYDCTRDGERRLTCTLVTAALVSIPVCVVGPKAVEVFAGLRAGRTTVAVHGRLAEDAAGGLMVIAYGVEVLEPTAQAVTEGG